MTFKKQRKNEQIRQFLGMYSSVDGQAVVGELKLKGENTLLKVHSEDALESLAAANHIVGTSFKSERLTLIDCFSPGVGHTHYNGEPIRHHADIFPHYVAIGRRHIKPAAACIKSIHFTATDLMDLFYDFDAFSHVIDAKPIIDMVLAERRKMRPVETGEHPEVAYFTGKTSVVKVDTTIGKVSVNHQPSYSMGGPAGVFIKNTMVVTIAAEEPISFEEAIDKMYVVATFLSVAAGRVQGISNVQITTTEDGGGEGQTLRVHPSYPWKALKTKLHKPHPGDVPFDPIRYRMEFEKAFNGWVARHGAWRTARSRYIGCLQKANEYGADRLVAAANMFDILPPDAVPNAAELSPELENVRDQCRALFRKLPSGIDRNSALDALGRLGKPSLPKKVSHRVSIIEPVLGQLFPDLNLPAAVAVKCRNFFVHGGSGDIDYARVERLLPFLTNTLEFVFAASDLIECGWDAQRWAAQHYGWGHSFTRYRSEYSHAMLDLRKALAD